MHYREEVEANSGPGPSEAGRVRVMGPAAVGQPQGAREVGARGTGWGCGTDTTPPPPAPRPPGCTPGTPRTRSFQAVVLRVWAGARTDRPARPTARTLAPGIPDAIAPLPSVPAAQPYLPRLCSQPASGPCVRQRIPPRRPGVRARREVARSWIPPGAGPRPSCLAPPPHRLLPRPAPPARLPQSPSASGPAHPRLRASPPPSRPAPSTWSRPLPPGAALPGSGPRPFETTLPL